MSRRTRLRLAVCFGINMVAMWITITRMLSSVTPFDWLMLIVELLVLLLIAYEVATNVLHKRRVNHRLKAIFAIMHKGQALQAAVPGGNADNNAITAWNDAVLAWINDANNLLSTYSPQASASFLHEPGGNTIKYSPVAMTAHNHYVFLLMRLNNLRSIMEKPDVYF